MSRRSKRTPGTLVSPMEIDDLIVRVRDLRTHLESNKRHLNMIDGRLARVEAELDAVKDVLAMGAPAEEEEVPEPGPEPEKETAPEPPEEEKA